MSGISLRKKVLAIVKLVQHGRGNLAKMPSSPPLEVFPHGNWNHPQLTAFSQRSFSLLPRVSKRLDSPVNGLILREVHTENRTDLDMQGFDVGLQACGRAFNKLQIHESTDESNFESKFESKFESETDESSKAGDDNLTSAEDTVLRDLLKLIPNKHAPLQCLKTNVRLLLELGVHPQDAVCFLKRHQCFQVYDASNELLEKASLLEESCGNPSLIVRLHQPLGSSTVLSGVLNFLSFELQLSKPKMVELLHDEELGLLNENVESLQRVLTLMRILHIPDIKKSFARFLRYSRHSADWATVKSEKLKSVLPEGELGPILQRFPKVLSCPPDLIERNAKALADIFGSENFLSMVRKHPSLLVAASRELEDRLLELMIKFGDENALRMVSRYPGILGLSWERVSPKLDYLTGTMGRSLDDVVRCPSFLMRSLDHCIKPRYSALKKDAHKVGLSHMFGCSMTVFSERFKKELEPEAHKAAMVARQEVTLDFLLSQFGELGTQELLQKRPTIVNCDVKVLSPKLSYLLGKMGCTTEELLASPSILFRNLERCIIPRHELLGTIENKYSLAYAYCCGNAVFEKTFGMKLPPVASMKKRFNYDREVPLEVVESNDPLP